MAGHSEVDHGGAAASGDLVHLGEFLACGGEADLQALGFSGPGFALGFADAGDQVVAISAGNHPQRPPPDPRTVPHPDHHRRRHTKPARQLQEQPNQAVPKLDRALRTETSINDTRDFGFGKRLHNLPALADIGFQANRRLPHAQRLSHDPVNGAGALASITSPVVTTTGTRVPRLRFGDLRAHPLLAALLAFKLANRDLRPLIAAIPRQDPRGHHQRADEL